MERLLKDTFLRVLLFPIARAFCNIVQPTLKRQLLIGLGCTIALSNISVYFLTGVICKDSQLRAADSVGGGGEDCLDDGEDCLDDGEVCIDDGEVCLGHHLSSQFPSQSDRC